MERFSLKCDLFPNTLTYSHRKAKSCYNLQKKEKKNHRTAKKSDLTIPYIKETNLRLYFIQMWMDTFPVLNMEFIYGHKFS